MQAAVMEEQAQEMRTQRSAVLRPTSEIRIAAIADTHGLPFLHPLADVFIHAGDMTAWGEWPETAAVARELGKEKYQAALLVPGNHLAEVPWKAIRQLSRMWRCRNG